MMSKSERLSEGLDLLAEYLTEIQYKYGTNKKIDKMITFLAIDNCYDEDLVVEWYSTEEFD